jgi:endonuclease G
MALKIKKFLILFFLASNFITFPASCETHHSQPEFINPPTTQEEIKIVEGAEKETAIIHKNCLFRCPLGTSNDNIVVDHDAIILSSNKKTKFADWVAYKVVANDIKGPERKRSWAKDPKIDVQFTFVPQDYKGMSNDPYFFDRGHQAPLACFKNHPKWYVVNYLSNITPQKKHLNQGPWNDLESAERKLVKQYDEIYVLTGPYYDKNNVVKGPHIERLNYLIPSGYWKVIAIKQGEEIKTASFVFPQNVALRDDYCKYLASVPEIERSTGLKFFDDEALSQAPSLKGEIGCGP